MAVNKVVRGDGTALIDLTGDTVTSAEHIMAGYIGHLADGTIVTGTGSGGSTLTEHVIHLDFTDGTDVDIATYYDDTFISSLITSTSPTEYGTKTIDAASLDGTTWYERPTETWETIYSGTVNYNPDSANAYPYCWISELGDTPIADGSVWRITFDGSTYRCVAAPYTIDGYHVFNVIGNPKWSVSTLDDGSDVPFSFYNSEYGAWSGSANVSADTGHTVKIERLVTTA